MIQRIDFEQVNARLLAFESRMEFRGRSCPR